MAVSDLFIPLEQKKQPPPTRGVNPDRGTASANGDWVNCCVLHSEWLLASRMVTIYPRINNSTCLPGPTMLCGQYAFCFCQRQFANRAITASASQGSDQRPSTARGSAFSRHGVEYRRPNRQRDCSLPQSPSLLHSPLDRKLEPPPRAGIAGGPSCGPSGWP